MRLMKKLLLVFIPLLLLLLVGSQGKSSAGNPEEYKQLLLKFRAFSINPGEKIVGTLVTVSNGEIKYVYVPGGWSWKYSGKPITKHMVHCFSTNPSYAVSMTGKLPSIAIYDMSIFTRKPLVIDALVEVENSDGKKHFRRMLESELDVQ
jgi:hypothetical protein